MRALFSLGFRFALGTTATAVSAVGLNFVGVASVPVLATSLAVGGAFSVASTAFNIMEDFQRGAPPSGEQMEMESERNRPLVNLEEKVLDKISTIGEKPVVENYKEDDLLNEKDIKKQKHIKKKELENIKDDKKENKDNLTR
ncbi:MAG: hypothetical protein ACOCRX_12435 [Candidatus Woesearchaeota archaeon]